MVCGGNDLDLLGGGVPALQYPKMNLSSPRRENRTEEMEARTYQPTPTTALNSSGGGIEFFLKFINRSESLDNFFFQSTIGEFTTVLVSGSKVLPEESMVNMPYCERLFRRSVKTGSPIGEKRGEGEITSTIELQSALQSNSLLGIFSLCIGLFGGVEAVDIGRMMFVMVEFHNFFGNVRF